MAGKFLMVMGFNSVSSTVTVKLVSTKLAVVKS